MAKVGEIGYIRWRGKSVFVQPSVDHRYGVAKATTLKNYSTYPLSLHTDLQLMHMKQELCELFLERSCKL